MGKDVVTLKMESSRVFFLFGWYGIYVFDRELFGSIIVFKAFIKEKVKILLLLVGGNVVIPVVS